MRIRRLGIVAALFTLISLLSLRWHLHELHEVAHTYGTFHKLVQEHPELLYRYPEPATETASVPKIIHQIKLGDGSFTKYDEAIRSCQQIHSDWKHMLWTDENATSFISEHYPEILPHYIQYTQNIQRADILRYALLHKFGGVYLDLDITCRVALDSTPLMKLPFVTTGAYPAGVNNAFIASQSNHSFLTQLLDSVPHHDMYWGLPMRMPYVETMMSTGCMFLSNEWMDYVRDLLSGREEQKVYVLADERGDMVPHMLRGKVTTPIFIHGGASSWHRWDAAMILMIGKHYIKVLVGLLVGISLVAAAFYFMVKSRRHGNLRNGYRVIGVKAKDDEDA